MSTSHSVGTTALVTGASRGFGRATAVALVASGLHVVGVARSEAALDELHEQLGEALTPVVADVTEPGLPAKLIAQYEPHTLVLNAGATPQAASLAQQTWENFSVNWQTDVHHVFQFVREALRAPLQPGSTVISLSSGAALRGSPMSGGYAGAKATIRFISAYAGLESARDALGIRFVSVLPQLTPVTDLGAAYVATYAEYNELSEQAYLDQLGTPLTLDQVGHGLAGLANDDASSAAAYLLTAKGISPLD
jgi:NADP-dependent 3-hydroxy acid dehydrogenase YdfG